MGRVGADTLRRGISGRRALALSAVFALVTTVVVLQLQTAANSVAPSTTQLISKTSDNPPLPPAQADKQGFNPSDSPSQSADGRFTAFVSANNLDPLTKANPGGNPNTDPALLPRDQVYLRDRVNGTTTWISNVTNCIDGTVVCDAFQPSISPDGRFVAFTTRFANQAPSEACPRGSGCQVYLYDAKAASPHTTLVSTADGAQPASGENFQPAVTANGLSVAFVSDAIEFYNPPKAQSDGITDVFVHERQVNPNIAPDSASNIANVLISTDQDGNRADGNACDCSLNGATNPSISSDGRVVTFQSDGRLVPETRGDRQVQVYAHDRDTLGSNTFDRAGRGLTAVRLVSVSSTAPVDPVLQPALCVNGVAPPVQCPATSPSISGNGQLVAFTSNAFNLAGNSNNAASQVFVHDRSTDSNITLLAVSPTDSGGSDWSFSFDQPVGPTTSVLPDPRKFELIPIAAGVAPVFGQTATVSNFDDTVVNVTFNAKLFSIGRGAVRPGAVTFPPAYPKTATTPATPAAPNPLETTHGNDKGTPNLVLVAPSTAAPNTLRYSFDGPVKLGVGSFSVFDTNGKETSAGSSVLAPPGAPTTQAVDATFDPNVFASAVGASAAQNAVTRTGENGQDAELLQPVRPMNVVASVDSKGVEGDNSSSAPSISLDGRTVAFASFAQNLDGASSLDQCNQNTVPQRVSDVYAHDIVGLGTHRVSLSSADSLGTCSSDQPSVSGNGRYIAFHSLAGNLAPDANDGETNVDDVFLRDRAPLITITPTPFDFGSVHAGSMSSAQTFTITNTGEGAAVLGGTTIGGANPGDFVVAANTCNTTPALTLFPKDTCTVTINFLPTATGSRAASLTVASDAPAPGNSVSDPLTGTGTQAALSIAPHPDNFGNVLLGSSGISTLTVTNTGTGSAGIASTGITGTNAANFSVVTDLCSGQSIPSGGTCTITVKFAPSAVGARTANLLVNSDVIGSPLVDPLSGTGIQSAITLSPVPDKFLFVPLTTAVTSAVTATNTGTAPATITATAVSGTTTEFTETTDGCTGKTLVPGANCQIVLRFAPTAPGDRAGLLTVADNAPGNPHTDSLTGRGVQLQILPNIGAPSDVATVTGDGWQPSHLVNVTWDPGLGSQQVTTDATGHFSVLMLLFRHDNIGPRKVKANDGTTIIKQPFLAVPGSSGPPGWILRR